MDLRGTWGGWKIKRIVEKYVLLKYLDFNKHFDIYTDEINYKLFTVIIQEVKLIQFFIRNLTGPQTRFYVMEKEWLSILETLK